MKPYLNIFIILILVLNSAFAYDELRKEKKALIETIKKEYVVSLAKDYQEWLMVNFSKSEKNDTTIKPMEYDSQLNSQNNNTVLAYKTVPVASSNRFKDFKFNIVNDQAVVQFTVDHKMKSAFLEKENGQWKLICAADIDPVL